MYKTYKIFSTLDDTFRNIDTCAGNDNLYVVFCTDVQVYCDVK